MTSALARSTENMVSLFGGISRTFGFVIRRAVCSLVIQSQRVERLSDGFPYFYLLCLYLSVLSCNCNVVFSGVNSVNGLGSAIELECAVICLV